MSFDKQSVATVDVRSLIFDLVLRLPCYQEPSGDFCVRVNANSFCKLIDWDEPTFVHLFTLHCELEKVTVSRSWAIGESNLQSTGVPDLLIRARTAQLCRKCVAAFADALYPVPSDCRR